MARYAIIENGVVANIVEADGPLAGLNMIAAGPADIGDTWSAGVFGKPPPPAPTVPSEITMRQARLALLGAGKLAAVSAAIAAMPEPNRSAATIEWEYSSGVQRHNGFVAQLGPALGLTEAQIDALFIAGAKL